MVNQSYERRYDARDAMGFAAGLLFGGLAGAVAMLLLAPQSGEATRAKIQQKGIELRDQTAEAVDAATEQVRVKARQITAGVREKSDELQQYGQGMLDGQLERWSQVVESDKTAV